MWTRYTYEYVSAAVQRALKHSAPEYGWRKECFSCSLCMRLNQPHCRLEQWPFTSAFSFLFSLNTCKHLLLLNKTKLIVVVTIIERFLCFWMSSIKTASANTGESVLIILWNRGVVFCFSGERRASKVGGQEPLVHCVRQLLIHQMFLQIVVFIEMYWKCSC